MNAATGYKPNLHLTGLTVLNGHTSVGGGGGLYAKNAGYILIEYCRFTGDKSLTPGGAVQRGADGNP